MTPEHTQPNLKIISHAEMNEAADAGLVTPLGRTVAFVVHYDDTWWIHYERGWIRADQPLADMLDVEYARINIQDAIIARSAEPPNTSGSS